MNTPNYKNLLSFIRNILERNDCFFDIVHESTIRLSSYLNMWPIIEVTNEDVSLTCPVAYYVTDEQCAAILNTCNTNRQVWFTEFGWGPCLGDCEDTAKVVFKYVPESVVFDDLTGSHLIVARSSYKREAIIADPDEFYDSISLIIGYAELLRREKLFQVVYNKMPKLYCDPKDPMSLFYCFLFLYGNQAGKQVLPIDWFDVITSHEYCKQSVFYPSILSDSFENLVSRMSEMIEEDVLQNEPYGLLLSVTLPDVFSDWTPYKILRDGFNTDEVKVSMNIADRTHPYTAEMVLLKTTKNRVNHLNKL